MKTSLRCFGLLLTFLLSMTLPVRASHLLGGEIGYRYLSSTGTSHSYEVTLSLFSDCSSTSAALPLLINANPIVSLYNNNVLVQQLNLTYQTAISDVEITPVCPDEANNTACVNINNPIPGIKRYVYKGTYTLNGSSANWHFSFEGFVTAGSSAGRTPIIQNADVLFGSSLMYLKATLNNMSANNSSCTFTSPPTPFFCVNKAQTYNLGAVDPDNDSLHFSLVDAQQLLTPNLPPPTNITYYNPYTAIAPLPTAPGDFTFNDISGQMDFTPNLVLNSVVVNRAEEYRNGIMVGSSMREMTFVVLDNCNNNVPLDTLGNPENATVVIDNGSAVVQTCEGQSAPLSFDISAQDPDGDNITVTWANLPAGATGSVAGNGTPNPVFTFSWNVSNNISAGDYTFYVTFTDDGCPLSATKTISRTVRIQPFEGGLITGYQSPCKNDNNGFAFLVQIPSDTAHYNLVWTNPAGDTLQTAYSNTGDTLHQLVPGVYNVIAINSNGCSRFFNIGVPEPIYSAGITTTDTLGCVGDGFQFQNASVGGLGGLTWDFGDGTPRSTQENPAHTYNRSGAFLVTLWGETDLGCRDTARIHVYIDTIYNPSFSFDKDNICIGDQVTFTPDAGPYTTGLTWDFNGNVQPVTHTGPIAHTFDEAGTFHINLQVNYRACPAGSDDTIVRVFPYPSVNLGPDSVLCLDGPAITLRNLATNPAGEYRQRWNTGLATPELTVVTPGIYSLTLTSEHDCATTESVVVNKDCYIDIPNSFTPNGDGVNDYFFPRQLLSKGVAGFRMQVFNRWGQLIFETSRPDGRGWDGRFNEKDQPVGVYLYQIQAVLKNGKTENYTGNVTLIR